MDFKNHIANKLTEILKVDREELFLLLEYPPNSDLGDLSLPCFKLSKILRKSPQVIATEIKEQLQDENIELLEVVSGYLNIFYNKKKFVENIIDTIIEQEETYGSRDIGQGRSVVIDYSSPNIAKPFHVGHLRSTVIGNSLYKIFSFLGYKCVRVNHLGDWGTQFGKLIVAYKTWGNAHDIKNNGIDELLRLYITFHQEAEKKPELEDEARAWFVKLERGDKETLDLWDWFVQVSLAEFKRIYEILGVTFDAYTGESFYNNKIENVIQDLKNQNLLQEDDGASIIRLDDYGMPPALMLKKDGSSLYHTRDVAAAIYRKEEYNFYKVIYVTDYAQSLHFQQWFKVIELMGYDWANRLVHVAFGRVSIEGMSLSTRKGTIIKLEDLLLQAINKANDIIEVRNPDLSNKQEVANNIGVGAIIFNDLSNNRIKDINLKWDEALNFEGETGPYVQYTYARASSVLRKVGNMSTEEFKLIDVHHLLDQEFYNVVKVLSIFPEQVEQAMLKLEPSIITRYTVDLAQAFNRFYHSSQILVNDISLRNSRLKLVRCVQITLKIGLELIGLHTPEKI